LANHKSAEKRARQTIRKKTVNATRKGRVKTIEKKLLNALGIKDLSAAKELYKSFVSFIDRAAKTNIVSKNHANRKKSRLASRVAHLEK